MIYKIVRVLPYIILIFLAVIFTVSSIYVTNELWKIIFINLASSSFFVVIAYFFYDTIKSHIDKHEAKYIDSYIRKQISNDVFVVLYMLKKDIHGYNLESNTLQNILTINNYTKEQIKTSIANQSYIGFQIFKEMEDMKDLFRDALDNNFIIRYSPREYVINLLKIVDLITSIEHIFRNEKNYTKSPEKAIEFFCVNAKKINPNNEEGRFLLLKKTQVENRAVVYDSGRFDQSKEDKLLNRYTLNAEVSEMLADKIFNLNKFLRFWLPKEFYIQRYGKLYRIIKDYFSPFTRSSTRTKRIYVADIIEME